MERAFRVLQSRLGIVRNPALTWSTNKLFEVMTACVIMHNMIVEDEDDDSIYDQGFDFEGENVEPEHAPPATCEQFVGNCVIGILMSSSRMTWLSTCGLTLTTSRYSGSF